MSSTLTSAFGTDNQTLCVNTAITNITYTTTGVTASFANGTITISGTPTDTGTFTYSIPLTGGCGNVNVTGTITVNPNSTVTLSSDPGTDSQTVCVNTPISNIIYTTTGASGIGTPIGLLSGVSATYASNAIFISGTPTASGTFNYRIPLTGGCGTVTATGTITVNVCNDIQEQTSPLTWSIYPNPSKGQFTIRTENAGVFELKDILGKTLNTFTITVNEYTIQEQLPAGIYFVREQKTSVVQKLMIE